MAIFLDIPALVDLSVPECDQPLEALPCVPQRSDRVLAKDTRARRAS